MTDEAKYELIDVHRGATSESWLVIYADGRIEHHVENEVYRFLRYGAEAKDTFIALDDLMKIGGEKLVSKVQQTREAMRATIVQLTLQPGSLERECRR